MDVKIGFFVAAILLGWSSNILNPWLHLPHWVGYLESPEVSHVPTVANPHPAFVYSFFKNTQKTSHTMGDKYQGGQTGKKQQKTHTQKKHQKTLSRVNKPCGFALGNQLSKDTATKASNR